MIPELKKNAESKMQKSVEALKTDLAKIRTGRAHTGLLDHVMVEYYGSMVPVNQVANITLIDARTIGVQTWEKPMLGKVERAIRDSDLGLNPANMGELLRVPMPALTEERRRDLTKVVRHEGETAKVAIRNLRRDANQHLKDAVKDKEISEDDERRAEDEIQKLTDKYVAEIDQMMKCDLCLDRTSEGYAPMCASVCPSEALWYGTMEQFTASRRGSLLRDFTFGRAHVRTKVFTVVDDALAGPLDVLGEVRSSWLDDPFGLDEGAL